MLPCGTFKVIGLALTNDVYKNSSAFVESVKLYGLISSVNC